MVMTHFVRVHSNLSESLPSPFRNQSKREVWKSLPSPFTPKATELLTNDAATSHQSEKQLFLNSYSPGLRI